MRAGELIKILKRFSPNTPIVLAVEIEENLTQLDGLTYVCENGPAIQLCGDSLVPVKRKRAKK